MFLVNKYLILAVLGIIGVVGVSGCISDTPPSYTVIIQNFTSQNSTAIEFTPATMNVQQGTAVTWINKDNVTHKVVSDTGLFDSGDLTSGQIYTYTFNHAGSFPYHDSINPSMKGIIVVTSK